MKILILSYEKPILENIRGWDTYLTYFLTKAFKNKNIEVINISIRKALQIPDIPEVDFVLCVARMKYIIDNYGLSFIDTLKEKSNNKICCYGDITNKNLVGEIIFSVLSGEDLPEENYYKIWWCGDYNFLYPEHDLNTFYILLDHIHYSNAKYNTIYNTYRKALKRISENYPIETHIIADPNVVKFDLDENKIYQFCRSRTKWLKIIEYYRKTHIYCVTHMELGGLTVMETGFCGASIIIPDNYISDKLSNEVKSYKCNSSEDDIYDSIETAIIEYNISENWRISKKYNWDDVVHKIVEVMKSK